MCKHERELLLIKGDITCLVEILNEKELVNASKRLYQKFVSLQ